MSRRPAARLALAALLVGSAVGAQVTAPDPGSWPMRARDPQRSGWAPGPGRLDATRSLRWSYYVGGNVAPSAAMVADVNGDGADEIVAIVGGKLVARDLQDRVLWDSVPLGLTSIVGFRDLAGLGYPVIVAVRSGPPAGLYVIDSRDGAVRWSREDFNDPAQLVNRGQSVDAQNARVANLHTDGTGTPTGRPGIVFRVSGGEAIVHAFTFSGGYTEAVDAWRFPVGTTPSTHWFPHLGLGDYDGDGRLDVAVQQIGSGATRLHSGSDDASLRGTVLTNGTHDGNPVITGLLATAAVRFAGAPRDAAFVVSPGEFALVEAAATSRSWGVVYAARGAGGAPSGVGDARNVSSPENPYLAADGLPGYLVVNVFDSHDCEVRAFPATSCSDLDGVNDAAGVRRWHMALYNPLTGALVTEVADRVALAVADVTGDGRPEIVTQSAGNEYDVPRVTSVAAYGVAFDTATERTTLSRLWEVPNSGLAGVVDRDHPGATPQSNVPLLIPAGTGRQLLLYQGDPSSTAIGRPTGLVFVDAAAGTPQATYSFTRGRQARPVGLVRTAPGLTAPDAIVVSDSDGTFKIFNLRFGPPSSTIGNMGVVTSGGFIASIAAAQLAGSNPRRMDLVTTESDGALSVVPTDDATLVRAPAATARYFGGAAQFPLVVRGEDRALRVIVANHLGTLPYFAAINALGPTELWRSDPITLPPNGRFNLYPPGVADVNGDGTADVVVSFDGLLSGGQLTCCGSSFLNVVSGRGAAGSNHPLLWTQPFSPETVGQGTCCWTVAGATTDVNGDGRDDVAVGMNASVVVRTGEGSATGAAQVLYQGDNRSVTSPGSSISRGISYGWPVLAAFDPALTRAVINGVGFFGGQGASLHDLVPSSTRATSVSAWAHPEFSEGTLVSVGAAASYANPAAHGPTDPVGFGFGSSNGVFYALSPATRTGVDLPLRWARCLRAGRADTVSGTMADDCAGGRALSDAAAADLDGDLRDEFVVGSSDGYLYVLAAESGALEFSYNFQTAVGSPIVADVDGDGTLGLMVPTGDGYVTALAGSSTDPVIRNPRVVAVSTAGGTPTIPMPDMAVTTSESIRVLGAAWDDPSSARNSEYRARVLTVNGSPVVPWTPVTHAAGAATVTWIAAGIFTPGLRYVVEISAQAPGAARADIVTTAPVQIVDATPPVVMDVRAVPSLTPRQVVISAAARDATELRGYTLRVLTPAGSEAFRTMGALSGTTASIDVTWDARSAVLSPGAWSVSIEARDVGDHTGTGTGTFTWPSEEGDGGADAAVADATTDVAVADAANDAGATDAGAADAGAADVGEADAGAAVDLGAADGGAAPGGGGDGCGCRAQGSSARGTGWAWAFAAVALVATRRRSRSYKTAAGDRR